MWGAGGSPVGFRGMGLFNRDRCEGKTPEQLAGMRTAGLLVGRTLELLVASVRPGLTTLDLDTLAETHIRDHGGIPNFQLVPGYRHTLCTSVNEEIVHGIPGPRVLHEGDLLSIDCGAQVGLWNGDAAVSLVVGGPDAGPPRGPRARRGHRGQPVGRHRRPAGRREPVCRRRGRRGQPHRGGERRGREYGIVEDYVGHGIGTSMHMDPQVPNYRVSGKGPRSSTARRSASSRWWPSATRTTSCSTTSGPSPPATGRAPRTGSTRSPRRRRASRCSPRSTAARPGCASSASPFAPLDPA